VILVSKVNSSLVLFSPIHLELPVPVIARCRSVGYYFSIRNPYFIIYTSILNNSWIIKVRCFMPGGILKKKKVPVFAIFHLLGGARKSTCGTSCPCQGLMRYLVLLHYILGAILDTIFHKSSSYVKASPHLVMRGGYDGHV